MKRVTGVGGVFFRCQDHEKVKEWYHQHLGIDSQPYGCHSFLWRENEAPDRRGYTVWSPFARDTDYFGPGQQKMMVNYRVENLEALIEQLRAEGVEIAGGIDQEENGKFAWIVDLEGNRVELWEPVDPDKDPYLP